MHYFIFPKWVGEKGISWGILSIIASSIVFSSRLMPLYMYLLFLLEIIGFFYYSHSLSKSWSRYDVRVFVKKLFWLGVLLRIPWTIYTHIHNVELYGEFYFNTLADLSVYIGLPFDAVNNIIQRGDWDFINFYLLFLDIDDMGAPILNTFLLLLTGNIQPCLVPLIVNIFMGAYTSVFAYHIAKRHFGEDVARIAAIFCMLNPNLIWWCSSLMKEIQMTFFTFWFLDRMDDVLVKRKMSLLEVFPIALLGMYVFLYRAALGILLFIAFFATLVFISSRVVSIGKKIIAGAIVIFVLFLGFGEQMREQAQGLLDQVEGGNQKTNMEWRTEREHGNKYASYAGAAVFAPLIFTIPFPTVTYTHGSQEMLMEVAGGNFIKNILSFFVIMCMFMMLFSGEWRKHVFPIAYLIGYLLILVMSQYAQSGRFHIPVLPVEMMFAAYFIKCFDQGKFVLRGRTSRATCKKWFNLWCVAMFLGCISWQWYKLKGQGLI